MEILLVYIEVLFFYLYTLIVKYTKKQFGILIGVAGLFLIAAFRRYSVDNDCWMYQDFYDGYPDNIGIVEFSYSLITAFVKNVFGDFRYMLVIYSLIAITISYVAIKKLSVHQACSYMLFSGSFFLLQNMTQIRAACAVSLFLLSIQYLISREIIKYIIICCLATFFHSSAAIMFLLLLFDNSLLTRRDKKVLLILPIVAIVFSSMIDVTSLLLKIPIPYIQAKVQGYIYLIEMQSGGQDYIKVFNVLYILKLLIYYVFICKADYYQKRFSAFPIFIKLYSLSIISLPALSLIPAMATRYNEFFGVLEIFLYPMFLVSFKQYKLMATMLLAYPLLVSYVYIFRNEFFRVIF